MPYQRQTSYVFECKCGRIFECKTEKLQKKFYKLHSEKCKMVEDKNEEIEEFPHQPIHRLKLNVENYCKVQNKDYCKVQNRD